MPHRRSYDKLLIMNLNPERIPPYVYWVLIISLALVSVIQSQQIYQLLTNQLPIAHTDSEKQGSTTSIRDNDKTLIYDQTFYGQGFQMRVPEGYTILQLSPTTLYLDPPGEGPNPYSDATGEGTNPWDDISIIVTNQDLDEARVRVKADVALRRSFEEKRIAYHDAIYYVDYGEASYPTYEIALDDQRTLKLSTSESESAMEEIMKTLSFDR